LQKESYKKGWCQQTKENEPFKKVRNIENLPQILTILAAETFDGPATGNIILNGRKQATFFDMFWTQENPVGGPWLPETIRVLLNPNGNICVAEKLSVPGDRESLTSGEKWLVFDGSSEVIVESPLEATSTHEQLFEMNLFATVSNIFPKYEPSKSHSILHIKLPIRESTSFSWFCFNDFVVTESAFSEVASFPVDEYGGYRHPSVLLYTSRSLADLIELPLLLSQATSTVSPFVIPESVFALESLSSVPCKPVESLPRAGQLIALDGEFVSVETAKASVSATGKRVASSGGRQFLARISIIDEDETGMMCICSQLK